jgi:adenosylcobyric acid synthase
MPAKLLMVQGTASTVGKSIMVTALCRIFRQDGYRVAPFKSQNMALNSFVTLQGGEIGRAQAVQAQAAGIEPTVDMNPVLLKPESDNRSQVIVRGKVAARLGATAYFDYARELWPIVVESLRSLRSDYDIVVIEGAGSPAEINLRDSEIVNMRVALEFNAPVLLVGDVDRGGVFASLLGTLQLLTPRERRLVVGMIINKFRGDVSLLMPGVRMLEKRCRLPVFGVVPFIYDLKVAQEDSVYLDVRPVSARDRHRLNVAVIRLPHMSNYDDFDPLESNCNFSYVTDPEFLEAVDLIILPGTKNTIGDLDFVRSRGLDAAIIDMVCKGVPVIGICGGFQMLGKTIFDRGNVESDRETVEGLGLLDVDTAFAGEKRTVRLKARTMAVGGLLSGLEDVNIEGYEIHMGRTVRRGSESVFRITETPDGEADYPDGAVDCTGLVFGTYIHGLFHNEGFCSAFLGNLRRLRGKGSEEGHLSFIQDEEYDKLASVVRNTVDMKKVYDLIGGGVL